MLKIRCFSDFKGAPRMLVIVGKEEDYLRAATYLANKEEATLTDPNFAIYYESKLISRDLLRINKKECMELAEIFMRFGSDPGGHYHDYYDIETLNDRNDIELMISKGEYSDALFEEEDE